MTRQLKNRKLSPELLVFLRQQRAAGLRLKALAQISGVSEGTLSPALRGKTYQDVDPSNRSAGRQLNRIAAHRRRTGEVKP